MTFFSLKILIEKSCLFPFTCLAACLLSFCAFAFSNLLHIGVFEHCCSFLKIRQNSCISYNIQVSFFLFPTIFLNIYPNIYMIIIYFRCAPHRDGGVLYSHSWGPRGQAHLYCPLLTQVWGESAMSSSVSCYNNLMILTVYSSRQNRLD